MMRIYLRLFLVMLLMGLPQLAHAVQGPQPIGGDPRIRTYVYDPNQIFIWTGFYKYQSAIVFEKGESIGSVLVGDATAWNMIPAGNRLILKPIDKDATTNMTIITNKRTYLFELHAEEADDIRDEDLVFTAQFIYPETLQNSDLMQLDVQSDNTPKINEHPERYNTNYSISGSRLVAPLKIFDDGEFTYMEFANINADLPAVFQVDANRNESLVNFRIEGNYVVIERVAHRFTLRYGDEVACVFNDSDPLKLVDVPKDPAKEKKFLGIF